MRSILLVLIISNTAFSQRPGIFISARGFYRGIYQQPIVLPENVRTRILYRVPTWIYPSYRRDLEPQNLQAQIEPLQPLLPTQQERPNLEAFGSADEERHNPAAILALVPAAQNLIEFAMMVATDDNPMTPRMGVYNLVLIALGVRANLHVETAGAMREQGYEQMFIHEQLEHAHRLMTLQLEQLARALDEGEDVAGIIQTVIEDRDALGYTPPAQNTPSPPRRRFWEGFRSFWRGGS